MAENRWPHAGRKLTFASVSSRIRSEANWYALSKIIRRNQYIINYDEKHNGRVIFLDRTPICVLIYSKSLNLKSKDYGLILDMFNSVKWREDYVIYLTAQPETILRRIVHRGAIDQIRRDWNEKDKEYLLKILVHYKNFLLDKNQNIKIFIIDTDKSTPESVVEKIKNIVIELSGYSFEKIDKPPPAQKNLNEYL